MTVSFYKCMWEPLPINNIKKSVENQLKIFRYTLKPLSLNKRVAYSIHSIKERKREREKIFL